MATDLSQIKDPSDVTCLVLDQGLFFEQAVTLAKTYKKVYYCVPWQSAFPKMNVGYIGHGFEDEGVEIVESLFGPHFDDIDLFFFPDLNFGHLQEHLESLGKVVWGGRMGECLETSREGLKQILKVLDLPVGGFEIIKGIENLRLYLQKHENVFVKINKWRGQFETFRSSNYDEVMPKLDQIELDLGAFKHIVEFIVEDELPDRVEWGVDFWGITGDDGVCRYPEKLFSGIEIKDKGFIARYTDYKDFPEPLSRVTERLKPVLAAYNYRGYFSTEIRIGKDYEPYFIDACTRSPSPPNEAFQIGYSNLAECIWAGANGIVIEPKAEAEFACELMVHSSFADKNWQPVAFPKELRERVKLRNPAKIDGKYYCIPQACGLPEIGAVVGLGDTMQDAIDDALEIAEQVTGYYIETITSAADEAVEQVEAMKKLGLSMFE